MTVDLMDRCANLGYQDENWKESKYSGVHSGKMEGGLGVDMADGGNKRY